MINIQPKWQKQMLTIYNNDSKNEIRDTCSHGTSLDSPR